MVARGSAVALVLGLVGAVSAAPAQAVTTYNPFEVNQGFTWLATGDLALGNGELEGSAAAFGTLESVTGNYPVIHNTAGMPDYTVPTIDGDPVRLLADRFVGTGAIDLTNRDDSGTLDPDSDEREAIAKFADTSNLTGSERGSSFTRLSDPDGGVLDLESLTWDPDTWQGTVTTQQPVPDYFPDTDGLVEQTNTCLAEQYTDPELANEVTVTPVNGSDVELSGFDATRPNYVYYDDIAGAAIAPSGEGYTPTAQAPLIVKVTDPTTTIGPINVEGWSADASQQQEYARYIMLDLSTVTGPVTIDGLELGAVWAPGVDLTFVGSRTTNGQWFADDVVTSGGGEIHHHAFLGQLLCDDGAPAIDSEVAVSDAEDGELPQGGGTVTDTITYSGLTAGEEYVVTGELAAVDGTSTGITGSATFTPTDPDGTVDVTFTVSAADAQAYAGQDLVAFQVLTLDGEQVAAHEDLDDADQTFAVADLTPATFQVVKELDGSGAGEVPDGTVFDVGYEVVDGPNEGASGELEVRADGVAVQGPDDLAAGDVVEFTEVQTEVDGVVTGGVSISPPTVTLAADVTAVITVTNAYDLAPATFTIHKEVVGEAADLVPPDTEFTVGYEVVAGADAGTTGTLTVPADGSVVDGPELTSGDVVELGEVELPEIDGVVWGTPVIDPDPVVLDAATGPVDVTVTNEALPAEVPAGGFSVVKVVDGSGADEVPADTEFTVEWEVVDGPSAPRSGTLTVLVDGTAVDGPQDLVEGDVVELTEVTPPDVPGADLAGAVVAPSTITIEPDAEPATITATNTYDVAEATFGIHKEIDGPAADLVPAGAEFDVAFEITDGPSAGGIGVISVPADGTVVDGPVLRPGDVVTLSELFPPDVDGVVWGETTIDPETFTLGSSGQVVDVTVTNTADAAPTLDSEIVVAATGGSTLPSSGGTLVDTITYTGLTPGEEHTLSGYLVTADGERTALAGSTTFTPGAADGSTEVEFTLNEADVAEFAGQDLVAFQWVSLDGEILASHADVDDADQTFTVAAPTTPQIRTTVRVAESADKVLGLDGGQVIDTVTYEGLEPGQEYEVTGELVGLPGGETGITGTSTFTPTEPDGTVDVTFDVSGVEAGELAGHDVVVVQRLFLDGVQVASHEDLSDAGQTFFVEAHAPTIATSASVVGSGNSKMVPPGGATVVDTVSYTGLEPGVEYSISGTVMQPDLAGTGLVGAYAFTPTAPDGQVQISFEVTAEYAAEHAGEYRVVFEGLYVGDELVVSHVDVEDEAQTFWIADAPTPDRPDEELPVTGPQAVQGVLAAAAFSLLAGAGLLWWRRRTLG